MRITADLVMGLKPCKNWTRERIEALIAPRSYVLHRTALHDERVPVDDRIWLGINLLDHRSQRLFACDCAERALSRERARGREPDPRSLAAIEVARRYARGWSTDDELAAAWAAARDAAWDGAGDDARAAGDAAWAAARAAVWAAARAAVWAAAWDAARAAVSCDDERSWQIERLCFYLDGLDPSEMPELWPTTPT